MLLIKNVEITMNIQFEGMVAPPSHTTFTALRNTKPLDTLAGVLGLCCYITVPHESKYICRDDAFKSIIPFFILFTLAFCGVVDLEYPERKKKITPEQELIILKRKIREHGLELLFEEKGK